MHLMTEILKCFQFTENHRMSQMNVRCTGVQPQFHLQFLSMLQFFLQFFHADDFLCPFFNECQNRVQLFQVFHTIILLTFFRRTP